MASMTASLFRIPIDEPDTDAGFGADIVHARLMEASLAKQTMAASRI